jgi:hypothetical protein
MIPKILHLFVPLLVLLTQDGLEQQTRALAEADRTIHALLDLQERVRAGAKSEAADFHVARATREQVLRDLDLADARQLGWTPQRIKDRLMPGFSAELRRWTDLPGRSGAADHSPLLELILDYEKDLQREALRRLYRMGLANPLERFAEAPQGEVTPEAMDPGTQTDDPTLRRPAAKPLINPLLEAEKFYQSGDYAAALGAYLLIDLKTTDRSEEIEYRIADCLLQNGEIVEAATRFQALADKSEHTTWGSQARWASAYAEALAAIQKQREPQDS